MLVRAAGEGAPGDWMLKIDILTAKERDIPPYFMLEGMIGFWRKAGADILVRPLGELSRTPDISFAHIARTFVDEKALARERAAAPVVNGRVADISKRRISANVVSRNDAYDGPVIVKTNLNYHGVPEEKDKPTAARAISSMLRRYGLKPPARLMNALPFKHYPIYAAKAEAPSWAWTDDRLVVEKFLPEKEGEDFVTRSWTFFGDRNYVTRLKSKSPLVKATNHHFHEILDAPPPGLASIRESLQIDYGKFDYVERDGAPVLLDVNTTVSMGARTERHMKLLDSFQGALYDYLESQAPGACA